jgi:hypothetical protein
MRNPISASHAATAQSVTNIASEMSFENIDRIISLPPLFLFYFYIIFLGCGFFFFVLAVDSLYYLTVIM